MYSNEIGQRQQVTNSIAVDSPTSRTQTARAGDTGKAEAPVKDEAQISAAASQMASHIGGSAESDVRTEKVAALQLAIQSGSYKVPASDVADKLIQSMLG